MEEKRKARFHFNILDLVLVLLALLCILGLWQRENIQSIFESGEELDSYTISFEIRKLRSTTVELLTEDQELYIDDDGTRVSLGTIVERYPGAAVEYMIDENGNTVEVFYPDDKYEYLQDLTGDLSCRGIDQNGNFLLEGKIYLAVNQTVKAYTENADFEIRITAITKNN